MTTYKYFKQDLERFTGQIARWQSRCDRSGTHRRHGSGPPIRTGRQGPDGRPQNIERADWQTAWHLACQLDTLAAERIPVRLYNFIAKANGYC